jgi:hypothetical protein
MEPGAGRLARRAVAVVGFSLGDDNEKKQMPYWWLLLALPAVLLIGAALYGIWIIESGARRYRRDQRCSKR